MMAAEARRKQEEEQQKKRLQQLEDERRMVTELATKRKEMEVLYWYMSCFIATFDTHGCLVVHLHSVILGPCNLCKSNVIVWIVCTSV